MRAVLTAFVAAGALAGNAAAATPFTPSTIAGTWKGQWTNHTFGSTGPAQIVATSLAGDTKLKFHIAFTGTVFGCNSVPPESSTPVPTGKGPNHWNARGFIIEGTSKDFGQLSLTYHYPSGKLTGAGKNPPCAPGLSWTISGTFGATSFDGLVHIKLGDGSSAVSEITLTRS